MSSRRRKDRQGLAGQYGTDQEKATRTSPFFPGAEGFAGKKLNPQTGSIGVTFFATGQRGRVMSDSDSDADFDPNAPLDESEEETDHDVVVAVDDIAEFLSTQPPEYWPKTRDELDSFVSSFSRVPFELQPDEIIPFFVINKILIASADNDSDELVFDLEAVRKLDMAQVDKLVDQYEAAIKAITEKKTKKGGNKSKTDKKSDRKGKGKQEEPESQEDDSDAARLRFAIVIFSCQWYFWLFQICFLLLFFIFSPIG
jgi:hypothetical protein